VAASLLLLTIGFADRALRRPGRGLVLPGTLLGCTLLSHFLYGYMGAVSVVLLAVIRRAGLRRLLALGGVAALLSAHQLFPLLTDRRFLNHSLWEEPIKWNSYGAGTVLQWLFTGQLLDFGRPPVLSLLAAQGTALVILSILKRRGRAPVPLFLLSGAALWIVLYFGRPFWGRAMILFGISRDFHVHRLIGGVHVFLVLLAAVGLGTLWRAASRRGLRGAAIGVAATAILLYPAIAERARYLEGNYENTAELAAKFDNLREDLDEATKIVKERGGRVWPMTVSQHPKELGVWFFLEARGLAIVPHVSHSMALTADILVVSDQYIPELYRQYNARTYLLQGWYVKPPSFLKPLRDIGGLQMRDTPATGYFDVVQVARSVPTTPESFLTINRRWLKSAWPAKNSHLWLDFGDAPPDLPRLSPEADLPESPVDASNAGKVVAERQTGEVYEADYDAAQPAYLVFRMTWHPNWKVRIDGQETPTMMLSPGVIGARTPPGRHHVVCRYEPGVGKIVMLLAGVLLVGLAGIAEFRTRRRIPLK
jgi:hypothetical protein